MKPDVLLELLEAAAEQLSVKVSYEQIEASVGRGGLCRVKGQYRVIIDKRATPQERVATLATALAPLIVQEGGTAELELPAKAREVLDFYADRRRVKKAS